ncbi:DUF4143 domain-containing protein [Isoptericola sp. b515]|uniref:ATP-binding protein n=1 Tax=Isoptericola sp. b515 TaxID=3064652 RepID=UPI0027130DA6|nr:DUF4143 domain-containing protein [Isoptericola sp. b515]MDO8148367.1 DUF4143 domain-containing protein [Isoptericola sp. b515]
MEAYRRRVLDAVLDDLQPNLRAVVIQGAKGVGKTATAARRARSVIRLDREVERIAFAAEPEVIREMPGPVLLDEWQRWPESWDVARRAVDDGVARGHLILAGSSAPRGATVHSGAGRIVPFRLRPMSLSERGVDDPTVSLADLLAGEATVRGATSLSLSDYAEQIVATGFPGIYAEPARTRPALVDAYLENLVQREFPEQGYPVRKPEVLGAWMAAYAAATSTTTGYGRILDAATPGQGDKPARTTTMTYRDALSGLWVLDPLPAWLPTRNEFDRLASTPKHQLADPGLAARLLRATGPSLVRGRHDHLLGPLFEHLVALCVQVYAQPSGATVSHLRTRNGDHEVDLVVEGPDGGVVAIEVMVTPTPTDGDLKHLRWLRGKLGDDLADAVVVTTGPRAYRRQDGIAVVPAALLGP